MGYGDYVAKEPNGAERITSPPLDAKCDHCLGDINRAHVFTCKRGSHASICDGLGKRLHYHVTHSCGYEKVYWV